MKIKPKRLEKGQTIGVVSPASPSFYKSEIVRGISTLKEWGFNVVTSDNLSRRYAYLAGPDKARAGDLNEMFSREDIDAIFVTQGGYGSARLLRYLDFDIIRENPKIFIGFSDITSIHLAILKKTGLVTFHGPGMSRFNTQDLTPYTEEQLFKALSSPDPIGEIVPADETKWINIFRGGKARGELVGGNLSLICASLGTPYEIDTAGKIFFFEELETEPWLIDHMLTHLLNAGKLQEAAGIVVGECKNCEPSKLNPGFHVTFSLEDVLEDFLTPLGVPVIFGLPLGHTRDLATVPLGVEACIDGDEGSLFIEECATVD
ncbi:MAG: LD-carboxypeptidase [Spirochaetales bacterium]|nr:LD-carboxypeptidase [Spirochaetales bacterium]